MFNNPYIYNPNMNQQSLSERIDSQIAQLNQMKEQIKTNHQPAINQTFQIAPTTNGIRYADTIDEVSKESIYSDTPFFSKDMSILWIKDLKGNIRTYELNEIIPKDAKDMQIELLQAQIEELRGMIKHDANVTDVDAKQDTTDSTTNDDTDGTATKKS